MAEPFRSKENMRQGDPWLSGQTGPTGPPPPPPTLISSPTAGSTVPPVHDVIGTGPIGATMALWYTHSDFPGQDRDTGATAQVDPLGTFLFAGDSAMAPGEVEWFVRSAGPPATESPRVAVTVAAP